MGILSTDVFDPACTENFTAQISSAKTGPDTKGRSSVRILRTTEELDEFRKYWDSWCADPSADFENYLASARWRPNFVRPHVMIVFKNGHPDCILAGWLEHRQLRLRIGYTSILQPYVSQLLFAQGGFMGNLSQENARALAQELKFCFRRGEADTAELPRLTADSPLYSEVRTEFGFLQRGHFTPRHEHRWAELPENFPEFLKGLSRKNRHELRRHEKKLAEEFAGRFEIRCYRKENEINELTAEIEKIASKTYQRGLGAGFQQDDETLASLRSSARLGRLRACVLYLGDQPRAFFIGKQARETLFGTFMGFDPKFSKYSPGLMILMHSIEECFDHDTRATRLDLGWGDRHYKRIFCNRTKQDGHIYLYPLSCRGAKLNFLRSTISLFDLGAKKLLEKSPFLQRLKKQWLNRIGRSTAKPEPFEEECME